MKFWLVLLTITATGTAQGGQEVAATFESAHDTFLDENSPNISNAMATLLGVDCSCSDSLRDDTLIRFEGIFGFDPGQIPPGSSIVAGTLILVADSAGAVSTSVHRMLVPWTDQDTWDSMGDGVDLGSEATARADAGYGGVSAGQTIEIDVQATLQLWSDGTANYGWAVLAGSNSPDGYALRSSEHATVGSRPQLHVVFVPPITQTRVFQQGVSGYQGTQDTQLDEASPGDDFASDAVLFVDGGESPRNQSLLWFMGVFGDGPRSCLTDQEF